MKITLVCRSKQTDGRWTFASARCWGAPGEGTACIVCCVQLRWGERFVLDEWSTLKKFVTTSLVCASNSCKMVLKGFLYNTVFRRNSTYAAFIVAGAVLGEKFLNDVVDSNWRESNKGVRCLPHNSFVALLPCCLPHPSMLSAAPSLFHILFRNCSTTKSSLNPSERLEHLHEGAFENILLSSWCCLV